MVAGFNDGCSSAIDDCLERAFGHLCLYCESNQLYLNKQHPFTLKNMHGDKQGFPWVTCKGSDTIVILKWASFYANLMLLQNGWSDSDRQVLRWIVQGADNGLRFSQGIHQHAIWLERSCIKSLRDALQGFGDSYAHLAAYAYQKGFSLYGYVPKLHALMHFRTDLDRALAQNRLALNPAVFDCSMSEDFIGKIARSSRRISFKHVERSTIETWQLNARKAIVRFKKARQIR